MAGTSSLVLDSRLGVLLGSMTSVRHSSLKSLHVEHHGNPPFVRVLSLVRASARKFLYAMKPGWPHDSIEPSWATNGLVGAGITLETVILPFSSIVKKL